MVRGLTASSDGTAVGWMAFVDSDISFLCLRGARSAQAEVHGRRFARFLPWVEMATWLLAGHHLRLGAGTVADASDTHRATSGRREPFVVSPHGNDAQLLGTPIWQLHRHEISTAAADETPADRGAGGHRAGLPAAPGACDPVGP